MAIVSDRHGVRTTKDMEAIMQEVEKKIVLNIHDYRNVINDRRTSKTITSFPVWVNGDWMEDRRKGVYDRRNPNQVAT